MQGQLTPSALGQNRAPAGPVNVCAAIELSKSRWVVAIQVPTGEKISVHKLPGGDVRSLLQLLARARSKLTEAGFDQVVSTAATRSATTGSGYIGSSSAKGSTTTSSIRPASTSVVAVAT
jgi:hypothetical protein